AVRLDCLPPPPVCCPRTRFLPVFRFRNAFRCLPAPFFFVTPGRLPPAFDTRLALPPLFLAIYYSFVRHRPSRCCTLLLCPPTSPSELLAQRRPAPNDMCGVNPIRNPQFCSSTL